MTLITSSLFAVTLGCFLLKQYNILSFIQQKCKVFLAPLLFGLFPWVNTMYCDPTPEKQKEKNVKEDGKHFNPYLDSLRLIYG